MEEPKVKSLAKAMHILEAFTVGEPELGITQLSEKLDMNKSNVHNMISTFQQLGYVNRLSNGKYCLGLKMLEYAYIINQHLGYPKAVYDILLDIAEATDEIVYFGLPRGMDVLYLYVVHPRSKLGALPYRNMLGEISPLYCTGIGKAMLAFFPQEEWRERIPERPRVYTNRTVTDIDRIFEDLERIRRRGYSLDNCEREYNVRCVGVPVFNSHGNLVAGISTSGPEVTMTDQKLRDCAKILQDAALRMRERIYN